MRRITFEDVLGKTADTNVFGLLLPDAVQAKLAALPSPEQIAVRDEADYYRVGTLLRDVIEPARHAVEGYFKPKKVELQARIKSLRAGEKSVGDRVDELRDEAREQMVTWWRVESDRRAALHGARVVQAEAEAHAQRERDVAVLADGDQVDAATKLAGLPVQVLPPPPPEQISKPTGVSMSTRWKAEVTDPVALLLWVAENYEERAHFVTINQAACNAIAVSQRDAMDVPGLTPTQEPALTVRAAEE